MWNENMKVFTIIFRELYALVPNHVFANKVV